MKRNVGRAWMALIVAFAALVAVLATSSPSAASSGSIVGRVAVESGSLEEDFLMMWLRSSDETQQLAHVAGDGSFEFSDLAPGQYRLFAKSYGGVFVSQWFGGTPGVASPTGVTEFAVAGATVDVGTTPLIRAGVITSEVRSPAGTALAHPESLSVAAYRDVDDSLSNPFDGDVRSDGSVRVGGLPSGNYRILIRSDGSNYLDQWVGGTSFASATVVAVSSAGTTPIPPVVIHENASLAGRVDTRGLLDPAADVRAQAFRGNVLVAEESIDTATGAYTFVGLAPGAYSVKFNDLQGIYADVWAPGRPQSCAVEYQASAGQRATVPTTFLPMGSEPGPVCPRQPKLTQSVRASVKKLRTRQRAALPKVTNRRTPIRWSSLTPIVCRVSGYRLVALKPGRCRLRGVARGSATLLDLRTQPTVRVTR